MTDIINSNCVAKELLLAASYLSDAITAPDDFADAVKRLDAYLSNDHAYSWKSIADTAIPLNVSCIVHCKMPGDIYTRCLAFATKVRGRIHWYGVQAPWHTPKELYCVVGYITLSKVRNHSHIS